MNLRDIPMRESAVKARTHRHDHSHTGHVHRWQHATSRRQFARTAAGACVIILGSGKADAGKTLSGGPNAELLVAGLEGGSGSTIGPGGALYVTEGIACRIARVDPQTGRTTTFASGLPKRLPGFGWGGAIDVAFIGATAYVLVTLVGPDVGGSDVVGIYRVDGPDRFTVVADIGEFNILTPPNTDVTPPTGVQYALQTYRGGFLITDGHYNRVLRVTLDGEVIVLMAFDDIVPTGLAVSGNTVYMAEAGPIPHRPQDGKVVAFGPKSPTATEVAPLALRSSLTWNLAAVAVSTPSRRATFRVLLRVLRRCQTLAHSWRSTETVPSPSSWTIWTGRPRSSSSRTPRMWSPSLGRSGRSTTSRVRPTVCHVEQPRRKDVRTISSGPRAPARDLTIVQATGNSLYSYFVPAISSA
jgi:hypothetical protein